MNRSCGNRDAEALRCPPVEAAIVVMSRFVGVNFNSRKEIGDVSGFVGPR
jgi:hypothetical protein